MDRNTGGATVHHLYLAGEYQDLLLDALETGVSQAEATQLASMAARHAAEAAQTGPEDDRLEAAAVLLTSATLGGFTRLVACQMEALAGGSAGDRTSVGAALDEQLDQLSALDRADLTPALSRLRRLRLSLPDAPPGAAVGSRREPTEREDLAREYFHLAWAVLEDGAPCEESRQLARYALRHNVTRDGVPALDGADMVAAAALGHVRQSAQQAAQAIASLGGTDLQHAASTLAQTVIRLRSCQDCQFDPDGDIAASLAIVGPIELDVRVHDIRTRLQSAGIRDGRLTTGQMDVLEALSTTIDRDADGVVAALRGKYAPQQVRFDFSCLLRAQLITEYGPTTDVNPWGRHVLANAAHVAAARTVNAMSWGGH
jgi:hypothetical protein